MKIACATILAGDSLAWDMMIKIADSSLQNPDNYQKMLGNNPDGTPNPAYPKLLNAENFMDYMLLCIYGGRGDWDHHNWMAARRKTESEGFYFLMWDCESMLGNGSILDFVTGGGNLYRPSHLFSLLTYNQQFKDHMVSRINKHFFENGSLTPDPSLKRYEEWFDVIDTALIADQARWVYSNDIWNTSMHSWIYNYFPSRTENVFRDLVNHDLYPEIAAPTANSSLFVIPEGYELYLTAPDGGEIYYTLDETDPGHYTPGTNSSIRIYDSTAFELPGAGESLTIWSRVKKDSLWSVLSKKTFNIVSAVSINDNNLFSQNNFFYGYPNPVQGELTLAYAIPDGGRVNIKIYNTLGKLVATPFNKMVSAGSHSFTWQTNELSEGIYFCILDVNNGEKQQKIKIVKK